MISPTCERAVADALATGRALLKFISPNDVGLTGGHQCGYYLPKSVWKLYTPNPPTKGENAESWTTIRWHDDRITESRVIWYGKGTRSEYRLTRFGRDFPHLSADSVGDLLVLVPASHAAFNAYVLDLEEDIDELQAALGVEIVGTWAAYGVGPEKVVETEDECIERHFREFAKAVNSFPSTLAFSEEAREAVEDCIRQFDRMQIDRRLLTLMEKEYRLFRMVERQLCSKEIVRPFKDVDDFLATAATITNRRKSRAGRSLENHVGHLLKQANVRFDARAKIDGRVEPDILIPGKSEYEDPAFPVDRLCVLGVKTTCKDRWRQVLNEGRRIPRKHILTIQPGISGNQLKEMKDANVTLVVPQPLHREYPKVPGVEILTVEQFVSDVQTRQGS